jgi:ribonuclease HII
MASVAEIDTMNILHATHLAMHRALDALDVECDLILVDGDRFKAYLRKDTDFVPHECVVDGDDTYVSIAAASILAKVERDALMAELSGESAYQYGFHVNAGYGTQLHIEALRRYGATEHHRRTFVRKFLKADVETREPGPGPERPRGWTETPGLD